MVKERDIAQRKRKVDFSNTKETKKLIEVSPERLNQIAKDVLESFVNKEDYKVSYFECSVTFFVYLSLGYTISSTVVFALSKLLLVYSDIRKT